MRSRDFVFIINTNLYKLVQIRRIFHSNVYNCSRVCLFVPGKLEKHRTDFQNLSFIDDRTLVLHAFLIF
jgi:hypothetical protein